MNERTAASWPEFWLGVAAVAATYGYFLLFAEFAFLELARAASGGETASRVVMGALGGGGVAGSLLALWRFTLDRFSRRLARSYIACALAAVLAAQATGLVSFVFVAAGIGLALGWNTVTLASGLRAWLPSGKLGVGVGVGTGVAYAFCNIPVVFAAAPALQTWISAGLATAGAAAAFRARVVGRAEPAPPARRWPWVAAFLVLVWLDSAAFYIIQHESALRATTWEGTDRLWINAAVHLLAALASGWLLDRAWLAGVLSLAWVLLAAACLALGAVLPLPQPGFLYAGGVSLYSAALVYYAACDGRPRTAAAVFAVAGWIGSALGIGMVQDLHGVPWIFVLGSGIALASVVGMGRRSLVAVVALLGLVRPLRAEVPDPLVARGREVYIGEGCIHCHSQYVRPGVTADVVRWGPARPLEELFREKPPLPGNRRQGPDLANVGNRRSPEWNRLHLQAPRTVSPGSRMPAYAHLFAAGDDRGEALLAYLASLGAGTFEERWALITGWQPDARATPVAPAVAARLFRQNCAQCHGENGRGDGPLAAGLALRPPDWARDPWRRVPAGDETTLARLIKFGAPGTAMAGHESLPDEAIVGLARFVKSLHK